jgi:hypothetical protein
VREAGTTSTASRDNATSMRRVEIALRALAADRHVRAETRLKAGYAATYW